MNLIFPDADNCNRLCAIAGTIIIGTSIYYFIYLQFSVTKEQIEYGYKLDLQLINVDKAKSDTEELKLYAEENAGH